jgi:hypothetical protein
VPWSDWQTGDTGFISWVREARYGHVEEGGVVTSNDVTASPLLPAFSNGNDLALPPTRAWIISQLRLPDSWATARAWFPTGLGGKVLGVDYDVRPDRAPGDLDQYVEYEEGPNEALSTVAGVLFASGEGSPPDGTILSVGVDTGTSYTPGSSPSWSGIGSIRSTRTYPSWPSSGADLSGTFTGAELFPTTAATTFAVGVGGPDEDLGDMKCFLL